MSYAEPTKNSNKINHNKSNHYWLPQVHRQWETKFHDGCYRLPLRLSLAIINLTFSFQVTTQKACQVEQQGRIQGEGGRTRRAPPLKLEKIWCIGVDSGFFTRNAPSNFVPRSARRNFFRITPPRPIVHVYIFLYWINKKNLQQLLIKNRHWWSVERKYFLTIAIMSSCN
jgi:hypothetical protein